MSLYAVQEYVKSVTNGVTSPNWPKPVLANVMVPNPGLLELAQPQLFIWGASATEHRTAIPRSAPGVNPTLIAPPGPVNAGWKERPYAISAWLYGVEQNNDKHRESKFPVLIEQVLDSLRMTAVPVNLVDSVTGEHSVLMNIGEEFGWEYDIDRTLADQRLIRNLCRIDIQVLEMMQF